MGILVAVGATWLATQWTHETFGWSWWVSLLAAPVVIGGALVVWFVASLLPKRRDRRYGASLDDDSDS